MFERDGPIRETMSDLKEAAGEVIPKSVPGCLSLCCCATCGTGVEAATGALLSTCPNSGGTAATGAMIGASSVAAVSAIACLVGLGFFARDLHAEVRQIRDRREHTTGIRRNGPDVQEMICWLFTSITLVVMKKNPRNNRF